MDDAAPATTRDAKYGGAFVSMSRRSFISRGEPLERATPEERELERKTRVRVAQIRARELRDAAQPLTHGVAVDVELPRDGVEAPVQPQVRVERAHEIEVFVVSELAERAIHEFADVALRTAEDERVGSEVVEVRDTSVTAQRSPEDDGLLGLKQRDVRAGHTALGAAHADRKGVVARHLGEPPPQRSGMCTRVDGFAVEFVQRSSDARARANDARARDDFRERDAKPRRRRDVAWRERDREIRARLARRHSSPPTTKKASRSGR